MFNVIKNAIHYVSFEELQTIKAKTPDGFYVVELDGSQIQTEQEYFSYAWKAFNFPPMPRHSWNGYDDWIRDLTWLNDKVGFVVIFLNFTKFLKNAPETKKEVIDDFNEIVLPFWEHEVEECVVGGTPKPFNVYIVD